VDAGVAGLHCITGDHPSTGHCPDARLVFDLDCVGVIELARPTGALCSAAHAPAAVPTERRLARLLAKIGAGADTVFVDHCGGTSQLGDAVAELRAAGIAAAADLAGAMLALPGLDGVNLSAGAPPGQEQDTARAVAEVGRRVLGARTVVRA
jgi:5,10-methylenetetrahydrofolate reductase